MTVAKLKILQVLALNVWSLRVMAQPRVTHVLQTKRSEYPKHRNTRPWHICFLQFLLRKPKILTFLEAESVQLKGLSSRRPCGVNLCRALPATSRSVPVTLGWGGRGGGWGDAPPCGVNRIGRDIYPALGEFYSPRRAPPQSLFKRVVPM